MTRSRRPRFPALFALCCLALIPTPGATQQEGPRAGPWQVRTRAVEGGRRWYPETSGVRPLVLMIATADRPPADTLLAHYLASQGYDVLRSAGTVQELANRVSRRRASVIAVLAFGSDAGTAHAVSRRAGAVRALIELDPPPARTTVPPGIVMLSFEKDSVPSYWKFTSSGNRLAVFAPGGRVYPGVIHAFLDYALRGRGDPPAALAARLRRAGLEARAIGGGR